MEIMSIVNLSLSRCSETPEEFFASLARACLELDVGASDVYGDYTNDDSWLRRFEREVANNFGKEDGLFLPSGIMAQSIVLKIAWEDSQKSNYFVCHYSSHIVLHTNKGYDSLLHLMPLYHEPNSQAVSQNPLGYDDVQQFLNSNELPIAVCLELPHREIGGKCTPFEDIVTMSNKCKELGIHFHMDGARLWEATGSLEYDLNNTTNCSEVGRLLSSYFDSVYVSFYKGIGGVTGAMLLGPTQFIVRARHWQKQFGGNLYSLMPYAVSCWKNFRLNKDSFHQRRARLVEIVNQLTDRYIVNNPFGGKQLIRFDPPIPQVCLIHIYLYADVETCLSARDKTVSDIGISCFSKIRPSTVGNTSNQSYFEMNLGPNNGNIPIDDWFKGWDYLLAILSEQSLKVQS